MLKPKRHRQLAEINVVPYIDVMLVLLVIFMITAPLLSQGVNVNLPAASAKPIDPKLQEPIVLSIDAQGNYYLNIAPNPTQTISATDLTNQVTNALRHSQTQGTTTRQILVKGDKNISYSKIIQAMVLLQHAGAPNVGLVTQFDEKANH
ncbi:MAG: protein TolR [Coxiellaceae bacterium]|jgi:biopolymer transport protein TolR|nr:protein TolR [Coxiellaceae bacterium]